MIATTTVNDQTLAVCKDTVRSTSSTLSQRTSSVGLFGRWGRRASIAPSIAPSVTASIASTAANSTITASCADTCDRCEELNMQSDINRSMLNDCTFDLKAKEAEVEALKDMVKKLQAQLYAADQANIKLRLEQARFDRELGSKNKQLAKQVAESILHADTANELAAQLTKQHKELTEAHAHDKQQVDVMHADHLQQLASLHAKLEAKDHEIVCLQSKLKDQEAVGNKAESQSNKRTAQLDDDLYRLKHDIEGEGGKHAAELHFEYKKQFGDDLTKYCARIADLEAENEKLYAQLSDEDDLDDEDDLLGEVEEVNT